MLTPSNKIIIVDNEPEELNNLGRVFLNNGLACRTFEYDELYDNPLTDIRIAFFDIKLNPSGGGSEEQTFSTLVQALKLYIDVKNKPFVLIFWTKHAELVDKFKEYVLRCNDDKIPSPFKIDCIDKLEFREAKDLKDKLETFWDDPTIKAIFDFEAQASRAALKTINRIFEIIPTSDAWGQSTTFLKNFEVVFSKIASHSLGFRHAKENPDKAIYEALLPILCHDFIIAKNDKVWTELLESLMSAKKDEDLSYPVGFNSSLLNTIFHIDTSVVSKDCRGVVISLNKIKNEFIEYFHIDFANWFSRMLPGLGKKERERSVLIAIEISSSCDFSQKKLRTNKYLLGVIVLAEDFRNFTKERAPQCLLCLDGEYIIEERINKVCLNLNFVFDANCEDKRFGEILFTFKKEMVDMIGNRYANHVSRIGITSF